MPDVVKDEVTLPGVHMTPLDGSYIAAGGFSPNMDVC